MASQDVIRQYLVSLGFDVSQPELNKLNEVLRGATQTIEQFTGGMAKSFIEAGAAVVTALTAVAGGTLALAVETAKSDLQFQLLARRMYMTSEAARQMKTATDALGVSLEDVVWGPPELRERYQQLIADQKQLMAGLGWTDVEMQMRKIRDLEFQFTRMRVEAGLFVVGLVKALSKGLTGDEDGLMQRLKGWNEWLIANIPKLANELANSLAPGLRDVAVMWRDFIDIGREATSLVLQFIGDLYNDEGLKRGEVSIKNLGRAFSLVAKETREIVDDLKWIVDHAKNIAEALNFAQDPKKFFPWLVGMGPGPTFSTSESALNVPGAAPSGATAGSPDVRAAIIAAAQNAGINPALALAIASKESGMNPNAPRGAAGEYGMMQMMPQTFAAYGSGDPGDFQNNLMASMNYLRHLHDQYGGNEYAMARSYNGSGPKAEAYARDVMQRESMFGSVTVNVYAQTNADPHMIAEHVHSTLKNMAQRQIVQGRGSVQFS